MNIKTLWVSLILAVSLVATTAHAQTTIGSSSTTTTTTGAQADSGLQNEQNFVTNNPGTVDYKGGFKTVPSAVVGAYSSSFSNEYCYGTAQIGASWLGGSITGGKPVLDEGCELRRTSDMEMRVGVEWHAEATAAFNLANQMEQEALHNANTSMKVTGVAKEAPFKNETVVTLESAPNPNAKGNAELIANTRSEAYKKELQGDILETASVYNLCKVGEKEKLSLEEAGFKCPDEKK
jgi:hypothetical protein